MTKPTIQEIAEQQKQRRYAAEVTKHAALQAAGGLASDMTLRDHFAGQALSSIGECPSPAKSEAKFAYEMADAMLEARKTTGGNTSGDACQMRSALKDLFDDYKQLVDSGDVGNWSLEDIPAGKKAMLALGMTTGEGGV